MAMTAWSAKVSDQIDLFVGERSDLGIGASTSTPIGLPSRISGTPSTVRNQTQCL